LNKSKNISSSDWWVLINNLKHNFLTSTEIQIRIC
jgi:hypothetical protein